MGAAFAIQVMTGKENNVKKLMEWAFARNESAQNWIKAVHTFTTTTRRLLGQGKLGKEIKRAIMPGYIFIEMNYSVDENNCSAHLPVDVWHLIKSIPGVIKQFTGSGQVIGADEFQKMLGLEPEEQQVEIAVPVEETSASNEVDEVEKNMKNALHEVNMAKTKEERAQALKALDVAEQQMNVLVEKVYEEPVGVVAKELSGIQQLKNRMAERVRAFVRNNKEIVSFPRTFLDKIIYSVDLQSKWLQSPRSLITLLFKYLRESGVS
ncbi:transcription termination/antitermination NusG family protein [Paenibacillus sp. 3LSP]|uniref:transcription termination/antitermination NusG family protein n=1 Tax=Paenibacillus TaxID=44249 RepID=UPI0028FD25BA|nr:transcription termination/antitermination NusG family protein [Paenibacillus sp. 3LSP]MDU0330506.1 transcription termination/antitermination NusG family protein [Paenibacillus sp. 3LSP]